MPTGRQRQIYNLSADLCYKDVTEQVQGEILNDYWTYQHKALWISKLCKSI